MTSPEHIAAARAAYEACPTPKPSWEQLGETTRGVWIEREERRALCPHEASVNDWRLSAARQPPPTTKAKKRTTK